MTYIGNFWVAEVYIHKKKIHGIERAASQCWFVMSYMANVEKCPYKWLLNQSMFSQINWKPQPGMWQIKTHIPRFHKLVHWEAVCIFIKITVFKFS